MKTLHRTLLFLVAVLFSFTFAGERCFADRMPDLAPAHVRLVDVVYFQSEAPQPFHVKTPPAARVAIAPVIFPRNPVPCGYHPQPAHC